MTSSSPKTPAAAALLKEINHTLFGASPEAEDVKRWCQQGFNFSSSSPHSCILEQIHGGPCGVLAPVNALVMVDVVYGQRVRTPLQPSVRERTLALIRALAVIIDRCTPMDGRAADMKRYTLLSADSSSAIIRHLTPPDADDDDDSSTVNANDDDDDGGGGGGGGGGVGVGVMEVCGLKDLQRAVAANMILFQSPCGVLLFVYWVLSSRSIAQVRGDMDDTSSPMVARFGHCSQEMVNLMLSGRAVTNVFDGDKVLGDASEAGVFSLHGIAGPGPLGFLTLLEAMRYSKVGSHLKCPQYPVWVIGSSTHYTFMFATDAQVGQVSDAAAAEQTMKNVFTMLDPEENGFIPTSELGTLMASLELDLTRIEWFRSVADADNMGIVTWQNFKAAVAGLRSQPANWLCSVCTFSNKHDATACDMCNANRPPPPTAAPTVAATASPDTKEPSTFTLYHVNGIDARCVEVHVTLLGDGVPVHAGLCEFEEVLSTRWPGALIEYTGAPPKIT